MLHNRNIQLQLIAKHYNKLTTSYLSCNRILELLGQNYYLPDMRKYVETYVVMCDICTRVKALHHKPFSLLQPLLILNRAWKSVLTNFIVKLLPSRDPGQPKGGEFNFI